MNTILELRKKYDLRVSAKGYIPEDAIPERDQAYTNRRPGCLRVFFMHEKQDPLGILLF